jgi:uncharacterized protein (DUF427 family)
MSAIPESTTTTRGRVRVEHGAKRIRAYLGGELVADTTRPLLVWEKPYNPAYYFPVDDVRVELLEADGEIVHSPSRGDGQSFTVRAGGKEAASAALRYEHSPFDDLRDAIRLDWSAMDAWFEEDEEVFTHPRDPYTRVDILPSSRHVRVEVDGVTLADTTKPSLLFETGHRTRYYLPKTHVRMDLLTPSESVTHCPYKGQAEYWSLQLGDRLIEDVAWSYPAPLPESIRVAGMICFYDEKAAVYVDDVLQE